MMPMKASTGSTWPRLSTPMIAASARARPGGEDAQRDPDDDGSDGGPQGVEQMPDQLAGEGGAYRVHSRTIPSSSSAPEAASTTATTKGGPHGHSGPVGSASRRRPRRGADRGRRARGRSSSRRTCVQRCPDRPRRRRRRCPSARAATVGCTTAAHSPDGSPDAGRPLQPERDRPSGQQHEHQGDPAPAPRPPTAETASPSTMRLGRKDTKGPTRSAKTPISPPATPIRICACPARSVDQALDRAQLGRLPATAMSRRVPTRGSHWPPGRRWPRPAGLHRRRRCGRSAPAAWPGRDSGRPA